MAKTDNLGDFLTDVANAIRTKKGTSGTINAQDFSSEIASIPSGGGTITGELVEKTIQSGNISKGDFVGAGKITINNVKPTSSNYRVYSGTITNPEYINDDNDDTYATITRTNTLPRIYFACQSATALGVPEGKKILSMQIENKVYFTDKTTSSNKGPILFTNNTLQEMEMNRLLSNSRDETATIIVPTLWNVTTSDLDRLGMQIYSTNSSGSSIYVYYVRFTFTYEDEDKIQTITSSSDKIIGVANENGTSGETIDVYTPSIQGGE